MSIQARGVMLARRRKPDYTDEFRSQSVAALLAAGWPDRLGALTQVANTLGIPAMTLSRWAKGQQNPPPNQMVDAKKADLADLMEAEIYAALDLLPDKRRFASYGTLVTGAAILTDKMRLLRGLPTEIVIMIPALVETVRKAGWEPVDFFNKLQLGLDAEIAALPEGKQNDA